MVLKGVDIGFCSECRELKVRVVLEASLYTICAYSE